MRLAALLIAGAAALAGATSPPAAPSPSSTRSAITAAARPVPVAIRGNKYRPHRVVVRLGRKVRWRNRDRVPHTVTFRDNRVNKLIRRGKSFTYRARRRGTIRYFCLIHADQDGVLVVR